MHTSIHTDKSCGWGIRGIRLAAGAAVAATLFACSQQGASSSNEHAVSRDASALSAPEPVAAQAEASQAQVQAGVQPEHLYASATHDGSRQFIIHVNLRAQVADVYQAVLAIEEAVQAQGGFVADNTILTKQQPGRSIAVAQMDAQQRRISKVYERTAHLKVRVPSAQTQRFLHDLAKHLTFLEHRQIHVQDAQLALLRERLNSSRGQQLQKDLDDVAASDKEKPSTKLQAVQAKDQAQAAQDAAVLAQKELEDQVAFSTIDLELRQSPIVHTSIEPDVDAMVKTAQPSLAQQLREGLAAGLDMCMSIIVVLAHAWPLLLAMMAVLAGRLVFRKKSAQRAANPAVLPQPASAKEEAQDRK